RERPAPHHTYCDAPRSARNRGGLVSPESTAYLTDKCEVRNRDVAGGHSVIARGVIHSGELIGVWSGRIVGTDALDDLSEEIRRHTVQVEEDLFLASLGADDPPDFINHSCEPNAGLDGQIAIVALQRIHPGDEVTIDYAMCDGSPYDEFECACGSAICRGRVTGEDWRISMLWERYAGHFSPYLERRIRALKRRFRRKRSLVAVGTEARGNTA
ncbi:MAG TPA: SET domain-containing protein, partial [Methyloceanibacter sp.]